jgi:hypothetical protein
MKLNKNRILPILSVGLVITSCAGPDEADYADIKSDLKESVRYDDLLSKEMFATAHPEDANPFT